MWHTILLVGCGGFVGAVARYLLGRLLAVDGLPLATLCINLAGCLIIGLLMGLSQRHEWVSPAVMALLVTGFCGSFTTFSTFANELWVAGNNQQWLVAALYLLVSVAGGFGMVILGRTLARLL